MAGGGGGPEKMRLCIIRLGWIIHNALFPGSRGRRMFFIRHVPALGPKTGDPPFGALFHYVERIFLGNSGFPSPSPGRSVVR